MRNKRSLPTRLAWLVLVLVLFLVPLLTTRPYYLHILIMAGIGVTLALGMYVIMNTGQLSLGHAAFMGIGGYTSVLLVTRAGLSFWLTLPLAGIGAAIVAIAFGYIVLRMKGIYFSIVTFAFAEICRLIWERWKGLFGGVTGLSNIPRPDPITVPGLLEIQFDSRVPYYYLILIIASVAAVIVHGLQRSRTGMAFSAIQSADHLAASLGINILWYKVLAFAIGAFFAGLAGSFYAHYFIYISPEFFTVWQSIHALAYAVIGGLANPIGPVIGGFVLTIVPEFMRHWTGFEPLFFGAILILVMLLLPDGIISLPRRMSSLVVGFRSKGGRSNTQRTGPGTEAVGVRPRVDAGDDNIHQG